MAADNRTRTYRLNTVAAECVSRMNIVSGVPKSQIVDLSVNLLYQTCILLSSMTGMSSREAVRLVEGAIPENSRSRDLGFTDTLETDAESLKQLFQIVMEEITMAKADKMEIGMKEGIENENVGGECQ